MAHLSEALLPPSGDSETCSSPRAGQGHISKEKAPESYSQYTPPTPTPMPLAPLPHVPSPRPPSETNSTTTSCVYQSETPGKRQC